MASIAEINEQTVREYFFRLDALVGPGTVTVIVGL